MSSKRFMVWSPEGKSAPKVTHSTHQEAFAIAHVMAKQYPGQSFYVLATASKPIIAKSEPA